jgi:hypothetical protein
VFCEVPRCFERHATSIVWALIRRLPGVCTYMSCEVVRSFERHAASIVWAHVPFFSRSRHGRLSKSYDTQALSDFAQAKLLHLYSLKMGHVMVFVYHHSAGTCIAFKWFSNRIPTAPSGCILTAPSGVYSNSPIRVYSNSPIRGCPIFTCKQCIADYCCLWLLYCCLWRL